MRKPEYVLKYPWATLGGIIFGILTVWKKKLPTGGPSGNQTVLLGCTPQDSLKTQKITTTTTKLPPKKEEKYIYIYIYFINQNF